MKYILLLILGSGLLASCHSVNGQHSLILSMVPPDMKPGQTLVVTARPEPNTELLWVSGTVKVMGFPDMAFVRDSRDGLWKIKTMIPIFAVVPPGDYEAKAWGQSRDGQAYEGTLGVHVK